MGGSLESRCVGRVYGADGAVADFSISALQPVHIMKPIIRSSQFCFISPIFGL